MTIDFFHVEIPCPVCGVGQVVYDISERANGTANITAFKTSCLCMAYDIYQYTALIDAGRACGGQYPLEPGFADYQQRLLAIEDDAYARATATPFSPEEAEIVGDWVYQTSFHGVGDPGFIRGIMPPPHKEAGYEQLRIRGFLRLSDAIREGLKVYELTSLARRWIRFQLAKGRL